MTGVDSDVVDEEPFVAHGEHEDPDDPSVALDDGYSRVTDHLPVVIGRGSIPMWAT